jgi:ABC-type multidrug transport system ATPase subunit
VCDEAVIMHRGQVRFVGTVAELRKTRGRDEELAVEVKAGAAELASALGAAGARCDVTSPVALTVTLPEGAGNDLVFRTARTAGLQVRSLEVRRESLEAAFLRVVGSDVEVAGAAPEPGAAP